MVASEAKHDPAENVRGHVRHSLSTRRQQLLDERVQLVKAKARIAQIDAELVLVQAKYLEHGADPTDDPVTPLLNGSVTA